MSDTLNATIQEIAIKHGVALDKNDPILMLQTMNDRLIEENRKAQHDLLKQFKEEMENISSKWQTDSKERAEKILNAALVTSKESIAKLTQETTSELLQSMKVMMSDSLVEARDLARKSKKFSNLILLLSTAIMIIAYLFILL